MTIETYANFPSTSLLTAMTSVDNVLTVVPTTLYGPPFGFPTANSVNGQFRLLIDAELMIVTLVSGNSWSVTRGVEGTTAVSHAIGAGCYHILTAGALANLTGPQGPQGTPGALSNWRSAWSSANTYAPGDGVQNGGSAYVCILAVTSATVPGSDPTHWSLAVGPGSASLSTPNTWTATQTMPVKDSGGTVYNVDAFGAAGDGTTLDDAAFASAITAAGNYGRIVGTRGKVYLHAKTITPLTGQILDGNGATLKRMNQISSAFSTTIVPGVTITVTVSSTTGFVVGQSVTFFNTGASLYDGSIYLITGINTGASTITVGAAVGTAMTGGTIATTCLQVTMAQDHIGVQNWVFEGNSSNNNALTYWAVQTEIECSNNSMVGGFIRNNTFQNTPCEGVILSGTNLIVEGNTFVNITGDGIHFGGTVGCKIINNYFHTTNIGDSRHGNQGAIVYSVINTDLTIADNYIDGAIRGICLPRGLTGNVGEGDGFTVRGNTIKNTTNEGIQWIQTIGISALCSRGIITGNRVYAPTTAGQYALWIQVPDTGDAYPNGIVDVIVADNWFGAPVLITQCHWLAFHDNIIDLNYTESTGTVHLDTTHTCLALSGCQNITVHHNVMTGGITAIFLSDNGAVITRNVDIESNIITDPYSIGIQTAASASLTGPGISIRNNKIRALSANTKGANWNAVLSLGNSVVISGNNVTTDNTLAGTVGITVNGGVNAGATGAVVFDNMIRGCNRSIQLQASSFNHQVYNNGTTAVMSDLSANSTSTIRNNWTLV